MQNPIVSGVIAMLPLFIKGSGELVTTVQADLAGPINITKIEETIVAGVHVIEGYTSDAWDAALEQFLIVLHEAIKLEELTAAAIEADKPTNAPGTGN